MQSEFSFPSFQEPDVDSSPYYSIAFFQDPFKYYIPIYAF